MTSLEDGMRLDDTCAQLLELDSAVMCRAHHEHAVWVLLALLSQGPLPRDMEFGLRSDTLSSLWEQSKACLDSGSLRQESVYSALELWNLGHEDSELLRECVTEYVWKYGQHAEIQRLIGLLQDDENLVGVLWSRSKGGPLSALLGVLRASNSQQLLDIEKTADEIEAACMTGMVNQVQAEVLQLAYDEVAVELIRQGRWDTGRVWPQRLASVTELAAQSGVETAPVRKMGGKTIMAVTALAFVVWAARAHWVPGLVVTLPFVGALSVIAGGVLWFIRRLRRGDKQK